MSIAYLNGAYIPLDHAKVSVLDRGFLFGDGIYEVIPVYNGKPFRLQQHLLRLQSSLDAIHLNSSLTYLQWEEIVNELVKRNGYGNQSIYLQITRGAMPTRDLTIPPASQCKQTYFAFSQPLPNNALEILKLGVSAVTLNDMRWSNCNIKTTTLLANVLLRQQTIEAGVDEAILIRDGYAMEGISSNLFVIRHGTIFTTPISALILGGVTRELILELAAKHGMPYQEVPVRVEDLATADEIWLTSSPREVMPVVKLNNKPISKGEAGPMWEKMIHYYREFKQAQ